MDFDLHTLEPSLAYRYLASVVVPRPIALVTTTDAEGRVNAAPFSFFNLLGSNPPVVALGVGDREPGTPKDTRGNIARSGEFVINLVDEALATAMNVCAVDFPEGVSELEMAGLTPTPASRVSVPLIAESPVQLECRLSQIVEIGSNKIVLGEVVFLHIRDEFVDTEHQHVQTDTLGLIGRMHGGGWYARTTDLFDMPRQSHSEWEETNAK